MHSAANRTMRKKNSPFSLTADSGDPFEKVQLPTGIIIVACLGECV